MYLKVIIALLCLLASQPFYCVANDLALNSVMVVANTNPLLQYQENGESKGPSAEILNGVLKEAQLKADISFMPWARAFSIAKNKPNTLIMSMLRTIEREDYFYWLIKVSYTDRVFISLKNKPENYVDTTEQAKKKLIAVILDSAAHEELTSMGFSDKRNLYIVSSGEQMVKLLATGRVELIYTDPNDVASYLQKINMSHIEISHKIIASTNQRTGYIALNKNSDVKTVERLQQAAENFAKTAEYSNLFHH